MTCASRGSAATVVYVVETHRPMWTCPRCGKSFVNRNSWHSCVRLDLDDAFDGRPNARRCFDALRAAVEADGPVELSISRTGIGFMTRVRFAGVQVRNDHLRVAFWLKHPIESPRFAKIERYSANDIGYFVVVRDPSEIDDELLGWIREAREIGDQRHPSQRRYRTGRSGELNG